MRMRILLAAAMIALLASPAYAQEQTSIPKYGEVEKDKTPQQIEADKQAQRAYQRSLGNIPDKGPTDPWGNVRSDSTPKDAAKSAPAKHAKTGSTAK
jgi:hypothetical protein